ncbi:hypothetical protein Tco_0152517 [Tanacetum coccineum]
MSNKHQELASPEQMTFVKDFSNLLMADSLPKTILGSTEAPPFVSSLEEQISLISSNEAVESIQEDSIDFDGNTLITPYDCLTFKEAE